MRGRLGGNGRPSPLGSRPAGWGFGNHLNTWSVTEGLLVSAHGQCGNTVHLKSLASQTCTVPHPHCRTLGSRPVSSPSASCPERGEHNTAMCIPHANRERGTGAATFPGQLLVFSLMERSSCLGVLLCLFGPQPCTGQGHIFSHGCHVPGPGSPARRH